ncbi:DNA polymerase II large subunit [Nanoarchaeota archaeon]
MIKASPQIEKYFNSLKEQLTSAFHKASEARKLGFDPEPIVDIKIANNMAERVEGLISSIAPQLIGSGMTTRIQELEQEYGALAWEVALLIAAEVSQEKFCKFSSKKEAMEMGIRAGFAYHTCGIVSAPLEGFVELLLKKRRSDGKEYFAIKFAGPIRGAGGTASSVCVLIADYVRKIMGYAEYDPDEKEQNRFITELRDYHERVTNLQYNPTDEEIKFLVKNIPVEIDGDPTEIFEVSNYKDLPRVETNRIRSGVCLVLSMVALKAPKLWKRVSSWGTKYEIDWAFLEEFLKIQKKAKAKSGSSNQTKEDSKEKPKITPNFTYIADLVAGRPILTHPMKQGGFRLRMGRSRSTGFSASGIHPSTQQILNKYIATGTQLRVERPGKATVVVPVDSIEPPIVKLKNGNVVKLSNEEDAKKITKEISEILFLGDILFNYGDFSENGHMLVPLGYCAEWYAQELKKKLLAEFPSLDFEKSEELSEELTKSTTLNKEKIKSLIECPLTTKITLDEAAILSKKLSLPLHPDFIFYWNCITREDFSKLIDWLAKAKIETQDSFKIILPKQEEKTLLEGIGVPHILASNEYVVIEKENAKAFLFNLGVFDPNNADFNTDIISSELKEKFSKLSINPDLSVLEMINQNSPVEIRDKCGTFIGARMGRPEKAKMRKMIGSPHVLFPVGDEGGRLRSFQASLAAGKVTSDFPLFDCPECENRTIYKVCEKCNEKTNQLYLSSVKGIVRQQNSSEDKTFQRQELDIKHYFEQELKFLKERTFPDLIKGVRGTSNKDHLPERLLKGILRAKHKIYVNKDGTTRYDMSELPITHFKPNEIQVSLEKLKELGYEKDINGKEITSQDQIVEIKPQDIILPSSSMSLDDPADHVLLNVGNFIDELLVKLYNQKPFYNLNSSKDLIGHLVVGLAPHISAGSLGRIIGFSDTQGMLCHPLFHAAMRRDCDGDEACVILLMDALLNFSRNYLPDKRGAKTMDAPLVLTSILVPSEVDDMAHGMDIAWSYPLEFYEAALEYKMPWDVKITQIKNVLDTEKQYEGMGFTHSTANINSGVTCSAYKTLPSMEEKLLGQMEIAEKIRAVDESDVARLVLEKHFLKDTRGNLRKFSQQQFRCVNCNEKFRRIPLIGRCTKCNGKIIFTVSEGSVIKYLEPSISLANKYNVPSYVKESLEITKKRIEEVFGKDKERQEGLGKWFG